MPHRNGYQLSITIVGTYLIQSILWSFILSRHKDKHLQSSNESEVKQQKQESIVKFYLDRIKIKFLLQQHISIL
jgi:hypothetical protein